MLNKKILIAEDERLIAFDLMKLLQMNGFNVCAVTKKGMEVAGLAEKMQPDLAMLDVNLKDGHNGLLAAKEILLKREIPILFITALNISSDIHALQKKHRIGYVSKPFSDYDVLSKVNELLGPLEKSEEKQLSFA